MAWMTVVELSPFLRHAKKLLNHDEVEQLKTQVATDPLIGDVMEGTGGFRKFRIPRADRGKSGGGRVVYLFHSPNHPVYLAAVYAKGDKDNLTKAERNELASLAKILIANREDKP